MQNSFYLANESKSFSNLVVLFDFCENINSNKLHFDISCVVFRYVIPLPFVQAVMS